MPGGMRPSRNPVDPRHTRRIRMSATATRHTMVRPTVNCFGHGFPSVPATTAAYTPPPGQSKLRVIDDRASSPFSANLLVIDEDTAHMPEWLRQAFPAPG